MDSMPYENLPEEDIRPASFFTSIFFGLVFTALGVLMGYLVYAKLDESPPTFIGLTVISFVMIIFGGIGLMILWGVFTWKSSSKKFSLVTSLQKEWESGVILSSSKPKFIAFGLLSLIMFLSLLPSLYVVLREIMRGAEDIETISWLFVVILPIIPLVFSLRSAVQLYRYGESKCKLQRGPGVVGSNLRVVVSTSKKIEATGNFKGTLSCTTVHLEDKENHNQVSVKNLFEITQEVPYQSSNSVMGVNFDFTIPGDLPPSDVAGAHARTKWTLRVEAPTRSANFKTSFLVPVIVGSVRK
ncbi:MAG TPA: hypothetical protein PKA63_05820 [Oligoflexia bacterium]|nr:hypothetical protein [Oligoflexia bacterium]HMP48167.1 hypothetical protein [Oligoflexia bacterium]